MSLTKEFYHEHLTPRYEVRDFTREEVEQRMDRIEGEHDPNQLELMAITELATEDVCEQQHTNP